MTLAMLPVAWCQTSFAQSGETAEPVSTQAEAQYPVFFKFLDARTGGAVKPSALLIDGNVADFNVEAGSLVATSLSEGDHVIVIQSDDHQPMEVVLSVSANHNPVMTFELDSATPESEETLPPGTAQLSGHVTDADTGELLPDVKLTLPESGMTTTTAADGSYNFNIKVPQTSDAAVPSVTLEVRADEFVPLRLKNLGLASGEQRRMPIRLERVTSDTESLDIREIDEAAADGSARSYEWVFDVTVR